MDRDVGQNGDCDRNPGQNQDQRRTESAPSTPQTLPTASRVLGLDHGQRRIGVAISDELGLTAQPLMTLLHTSRRNDLRSLGRLIRRYRCSAIVVGWPLHMSGDRSPRAVAAEEFAAALQAEFELPVHLWDERLSTAEANRHLDTAGRAARSRKEVIDQVAAMLILQSWLDSVRNSPGGFVR